MVSLEPWWSVIIQLEAALLDNCLILSVLEIQRCPAGTIKDQCGIHNLKVCAVTTAPVIVPPQRADHSGYEDFPTVS